MERPSPETPITPRRIDDEGRAPRRDETQPCPRCGHAMPALKGGSASICPNCGFKDSCCY